MKLPLFLLLPLAICTAASHAATSKIDETALSEMRKGQTTFEEIVRRFGRPNFGSKNWDGSRTAAYSYGESWSPAALSALGAALGGSAANTVVLYFSDRDVLTGYKINQATAQPAATPATPTVRYVEPSFGATTPAPAAQPAAAGVPAPPAGRPLEPPPSGAQPLAATPAAAGAVRQVDASPAAPVPATQPAATPESKPRNDGLPWWLPPTSTRQERY